jgi:hypothetical protein
MQVVLCWFLTLLSAIVFARLIWTKKLSLSRDWFVVIYFAEIWLQLHLLPTLYLQASNLVADGVSRPDDEVTWYYVLIQFAGIALFQWPLLFLYLRGMKRNSLAKAQKDPPASIIPIPNKVVLISIISITVTLVYLTVALRFNLLRMPRDSNLIPYLLLGLDTVVYAILRLFVYSGLFFGAFLLFLALRSHEATVPVKILIWSAFVFTTGAWMLQALLFSRWEVAFGLAVLIGVVLTQKHAQWYRKIPRAKLARIVVVGVLILLYLMRVTYNFRFNNETEGLNLANLNPFISYEIPYYENQDLRYRLNGVDLMARITPRALHEGYALGAGWEYAFYCAVGQWIPGLSVEDYKLNPLTDTKAYLEYRYTGYRLPDWPNCFLTDLYGNLSFFGFLLAAWLLARVFVFVNRSLVSPKSTWDCLFALFLISQTMMFESGFAGWLFGLLRPASLLFVLLLLRPFRFGQAGNTSDSPSPSKTPRPALALPVRGPAQVRLRTRQDYSRS